VISAADYRDDDSPSDEPEPLACRLLIHDQAPHVVSHGVGLDCVLQPMVIPVPDAQPALVRACGDPGAAIRGPLVGEEAPESLPLW
jgi:hypothetical protein